MGDKKVLMVLTSHKELGNTGKTTGFFVSEASHPYDVFVHQAGYTVDLVSPQGGEPPRDGEDADDPLNQQFLTEMAKPLANTMTPDRVNPGEYDAIFFAGGHGTMWDFPNNEALAAIAVNIYKAGGVVGAVCHGPAALVNMQLSDGRYLVDGKTVSAFTNDEEKAMELESEVPFLLESKLVERGATFRKSANFEPHVETDKRLVTGQNPSSANGVATQMWALLEQSKRDPTIVP